MYMQIKHVQIKFYANCTKAFISANVLSLSFLASSCIFFLHCFSSSVSCFLFSLLPIILNEISNSNKNNVHRFKLLPVHHKYWRKKKAAALTRSNTWCHSSFLFMPTLMVNRQQFKSVHIIVVTIANTRI